MSAAIARTARYRFLDRLRPQAYAALVHDITQRGVLTPIELDQHGQVLDGHIRKEIADRLGKPCPHIVRHFDSEQARVEHALKLNLARRHLTPQEWGRLFAKLLEVRGVTRSQGARNDVSTSATVAEVAAELGVPERTARRRLAQADGKQIRRAASAERKGTMKSTASSNTSAQAGIESPAPEATPAAGPQELDLYTLQWVLRTIREHRHLDVVAGVIEQQVERLEGFVRAD